MTEDCPICLDNLGETTVWNCGQHEVCRECLYKLFSVRGDVVCPCCRAPPAAVYTSGFQTATRFVWASDEGDLLIGVHSDELATTATAARPRSVLNTDEMALAVRLTADGVLLYIAAGPCTDLFLAMFELVPWFWRDNTDPRVYRRCIRELMRDVQGFTTSDGMECVHEFFRTYAFPVELTTDDDDSDSDVSE